MKFVLLLIASLIWVVVSGSVTEVPKEECDKPHQKWKDCGTACEPTCKNPHPKFCTLQCVEGCFCDKGLVKDENGDCIDPDECPDEPKKCEKPNQIWDDCGTACEPTCENPRPTICTKNCVSGCFCKKGLLKDKKGNCVDPKECPGNKDGDEEDEEEGDEEGDKKGGKEDEK